MAKYLTLSNGRVVEAFLPGTGTRQDVTLTVTLGGGEKAYASMDLGAMFGLVSIAADVHPCRVRLYAAASYQTADQNRAAGESIVISSDHGLLAEAILTAAVPSLVAGPALLCATVGDPAPSLVPVTLENLGTATSDITLTITGLRLQ
jgi:hypothetical protein